MYEAYSRRLIFRRGFPGRELRCQSAGGYLYEKKTQVTADLGKKKLPEVCAFFLLTELSFCVEESGGRYETETSEGVWRFSRCFG